MTQEKAILNYLETHGSIDPLTALKEFGCFRLGARICDLRKQGHNIVTETKTRQTENGKKVWAEYHMKKPLPGVATGERQGVGTIGVDSTSEDTTKS